MKRPVYLDYNATTPVDPRVLDEMLPFFTVHYGNASSKGTRLVGLQLKRLKLRANLLLS